MPYQFICEKCNGPLFAENLNNYPTKYPCTYCGHDNKVHHLKRDVFNFEEITQEEYDNRISIKQKFRQKRIEEKKIAKEQNLSKNDARNKLKEAKENLELELITQEEYDALKEAEVNESVMIDASHGNSQKKYKQQIPVIESISEQISNGNKNIKGVMIESHLNEGNQKITENLNYGQSITDACMGWDDTLMCLKKLNNAVIAKRGN